MSLARPVLRAQALRFSSRRFQSTTTEKASEAAKEVAGKSKEYQAKAQQGLSRVTSAAGPAISGAARGLGNTLNRVGGRTGKLIAFIERMLCHILPLRRLCVF